MHKFQRRSSSVLCTYATLLGFHSRERCCRGGHKDGCQCGAGSPARRQGNIPLLPVYSSVVQLAHVGWKIIEYTVVHATTYVHATSYMYSSVLQLVHVGWKIIEYTVVSVTSCVLYCTLRCTQRLLGIRVYCCALGRSRRY